MRLSFLGALILAPVAGALVAGCGTTSSLSRIDANRATYESWPIEAQQAVLDGRVEEGMTAEMVQMALGRPTSVGYSGSQEVWTYRSGGGVNLPVNVGVGVGPAVVQTGGSTGGSQSIKEVVFENGRVVSSSEFP